MKEYSNSIPGLPTDILIEVISRLPVKTLVQLSCVCKSWKELIRSDRIFIKCHLEQSLKKTSRSCSNVLMYSVSDWNRNVTTKLEIQRFINADENCLRKSFFLGQNFYLVGCVNGVFCLYEYWSRDIYLWNPALHQFRMLPRSSYLNVVAFFSEPTNDDYIVVKISGHTKVDIYKLSSNSWTETNFSYRPSGKDVLIKDMVALVHNGALHWLSYSGQALFLNIYDLRKKRFQETLLSNHIPFRPYVATLGLIKGCVSVLGESSTDRKYEMWMMKEYGVENSRTKQFDFPIYILSPRYLPGTRTSGKIVLTQNDYVQLYDLETEETEFAQDESKLLYDLEMEYFFTDNYVESLVSVIPPLKRTEDKTTSLRSSSFLKNLFGYLFGSKKVGKLNG